MRCDVFAAECLLPYHPFASQVAGTDIRWIPAKYFYAQRVQGIIDHDGFIDSPSMQMDPARSFSLRAAGCSVMCPDRPYLNEHEGLEPTSTSLCRKAAWMPSACCTRSSSRTEDYDEMPNRMYGCGWGHQLNRPIGRSRKPSCRTGMEPVSLSSSGLTRA